MNVRADAVLKPETSLREDLYLLIWGFFSGDFGRAETDANVRFGYVKGMVNLVARFIYVG